MAMAWAELSRSFWARANAFNSHLRCRLADLLHHGCSIRLWGACIHTSSARVKAMSNTASLLFVSLVPEASHCSGLARSLGRRKPRSRSVWSAPLLPLPTEWKLPPAPDAEFPLLAGILHGGVG